MACHRPKAGLPVRGYAESVFPREPGVCRYRRMIFKRLGHSSRQRLPEHISSLRVRRALVPAEVVQDALCSFSHLLPLWTEYTRGKTLRSG